MKKTCLLLALPALMAAQSAMAQTYEHLKLSNSQPAAGKPLTLTYNPAGTNLAGKLGLEGAVYYIDRDNNPVSDLIFRKEGTAYKATTVVPVTAKAFFVKFSADNKIDDNDGIGYLYKVYSNGKPVPGAYGSEAAVLANGIGPLFAKIKPDANKAAELYESELKAYPQYFKEFQSDYISLLISSKDPQRKAAGVQKLPVLINSANENDVLIAAALLRSLNQKAKADSLDQVVKERFPKGNMVQNALIATVTKE